MTKGVRGRKGRRWKEEGMRVRWKDEKGKGGKRGGRI